MLRNGLNAKEKQSKKARYDTREDKREKKIILLGKGRKKLSKERKG